MTEKDKGYLLRLAGALHDIADNPSQNATVQVRDIANRIELIVVHGLPSELFKIVEPQGAEKLWN